MCSVYPSPDGEPRGMKPYPFASVPPRALPSSKSPAKLISELRQMLQTSAGPSAEVLSMDDQRFQESTAVFNGAVKTFAFALVRPLNAADVSTTIKFCRTHDLDISVKAGGTGVHGFSIAGHVILDMSTLNEINISLPNEAASLQSSFERLNLDRNASSGPSGPSKRPSLASSYRKSSDSTTASAKRNMEEALLSDDEEQPEEKKRMDDIVEEPHSTFSRGSQNAEDMEMSRSPSAGHGSGSGQGSATGSTSASRRQSSTPATSNMGSEDSAGKIPPVEGENVPNRIFTAFGDASSSSSANFPPQGRMTYVNPSPTAATPFPFIPSSFGGGSAATMSYSSLAETYPTNPRLVMNTNPDPPPYTVVSFGAGVRSKQLDSATASSLYGAYHVPTSAFPVGSGQFILGGFGFLGRKHGLAMDNIIEAEMVLADGRIVWVGEGGRHGGEWKDDESPEEVWWGLRGAGPALGVVTRFRAKAYYVPSVYAGNLIYLFDKTTTPSLMRHVRDCIKGAPRTLYTNIIMTAGPPGSPAIVVIQLCFSGPRSEGDIYIQAISSWDKGRCLFQDFSERTFERQQVAIEEVLKGGKGRKWYIKSDMLMSLTDDVIDATCARFHVVPDGCTWLFEYTGGGACADTKDSCYPISHRESSFTVAALHQWGHTEAPPEDTRCVTTAEDWIVEVVHTNSPGGPLPCFLQSSAEDQVAAVYGDNWSRLRALKRKIDPTNVFRNTAWPKENPAENGDAAAQACIENGNGKRPEDLAPGEGLPSPTHNMPDGDAVPSREAPLYKGKSRALDAIDNESPNIFERMLAFEQGPQTDLQVRNIDEQVQKRYIDRKQTVGNDHPMTGALEASSDIPTKQRSMNGVPASASGDS